MQKNKHREDICLSNILTFLATLIVALAAARCDPTTLKDLAGGAASATGVVTQEEAGVTPASDEPQDIIIASAPTPIPTPIPTVIPIPEPTPAPPDWAPSEDVPLDSELQWYVHDACVRYGVDEALVLAMIEHESSFRPDAKSENCYGLMQIHKINYTWLRAEGIEPLEYPGNIDAGVLIVGGMLTKYTNTHKALMAYNCGEPGAKRLWKQGYTTSAYSRAVAESALKWEIILIGGG